MGTVALRAVLVAAVLAPPALLALAPRAAACPVCDGGPSGVNEVRANIFDDSFWPRVAATVAPFPVFAGIVALIYFGPPRFRRDRASAAPEGGLNAPTAD